MVGWGVYYLVERHFSTKIYPPAYVPPSLPRRGVVEYGPAGASMRIAYSHC